MDRYKEDEEKLLKEREQLSQRIQQAGNMLEQLKANLINVNAKLEYIQYRRKEESEELEKEPDNGAQEAAQG